MTIVVVDDSPASLALMRSIAVKKYPGQVEAFFGAAFALDYLRQYPARVIITDYSMSGMNGAELARAVRSLPMHTKTPVIMVTAATGPEVHQFLQAAGASWVLSKPFNAAVFGALLHNVLHPTAPCTSIDLSELLSGYSIAV